MARKCTVCEHPQRDDVDARLVAGGSLRDIAGQHGLSKSALDRHKADHLPATLSKAQAAVEVTHADSLLDQVGELQQRTLALLTKAEAAEQLKTACALIGQARSNLELLARLLGELQEQPPTVNLVLMPEFKVLLMALAPYPEARMAAAAALQAGDDGRG